jgi:hypothetical protein
MHLTPQGVDNLKKRGKKEPKQEKEVKYYGKGNTGLSEGNLPKRKAYHLTKQ